MARQQFKAKAEGIGPNQAWCFIAIPFDPKAVFGKVRVPIRGTINGFPFRSTILPLRGKNWIQFNKQLQEGAKAGAGDVVDVVLEADDQPREVKLPSYLARVLGKNKKAKVATSGSPTRTRSASWTGWQTPRPTKLASGGSRK